MEHTKFVFLIIYVTAINVVTQVLGRLTVRILTTDFTYDVFTTATNTVPFSYMFYAAGTGNGHAWIDLFFLFALD
jgi:hypothetical protein